MKWDKCLKYLGSSILLCPTHYGVQKFTLLLCPILLLIYTCSTLPCRHVGVVSCCSWDSPNIWCWWYIEDGYHCWKRFNRMQIGNIKKSSSQKPETSLKPTGTFKWSLINKQIMYNKVSDTVLGNYLVLLLQWKQV